MSLRVAVAVLVLAMPLAARAQQGTAPEPIVRVHIDPPRVIVGQPATLQVDVLAPNYMTSPPQLPAFQLRNAVTRQLQSVNINEQNDGIGYAGVRFEFAIYPLEAGAFALAEQKLTIKYAAEPPATREVVAVMPGTEFQAFIPDAAAGLQPFLSATRLTAEQAVQRCSEQLKAGDAVTRIVTVKAEGTPAMLLPPVSFPAIDGLAVYAAQPSLEDKTEGRSDTTSASRVDSATYMLERPGNFVLPAIDLRWWNSGKGQIETVHLDAIELSVAANPEVKGGAAANDGATRRSFDRLFDLVSDHWLLALIAIAALTMLGWFAPRLAKTAALHHRQRREAWLQSESCFFGRFRHAAQRGDARATYFALLDWLRRVEPAAPLHDLEQFKIAARDPALDREIGALERTLFAPTQEAIPWSPRKLSQRVGAARQALRRQSARREPMYALPQRLNPIRDPDPSRHRERLPAR
jgi:hypothetical protein